MENVPSAAAVVATPPISTRAPATGSPVAASVTVPLMVLNCASAAPARKTATPTTAQVLRMRSPSLFQVSDGTCVGLPRTCCKIFQVRGLIFPPEARSGEHSHERVLDRAARTTGPSRRVLHRAGRRARGGA